MSLRIDQDHSRFRNIVRGRIRQNLRKYISKGELLGRQGKDIVSIPIPHIDIPKLRFGDKQQGGVAQGEGENRTIEQTLDLAWDLLSDLPEDDLIRVREAYIEKYHPAHKSEV